MTPTATKAELNPLLDQCARLLVVCCDLLSEMRPGAGVSEERLMLMRVQARRLKGTVDDAVCEVINGGRQ